MIEAIAISTLKHSNIVSALNALLSEYFGCDCKFKSFEASIEFDPWTGTQGCYIASLIFISNKVIPNDCHRVASCENIGDGRYEVLKYILLGDELWKKIVEVMLEFN